jgi:hypothetical protein
MSKSLIFILFLLFGIYACKKDDIVVPVRGVVVDKTTKLPVEKARVIYNATETVETDNFGEFKLEYNLERFLADSINFYVTKSNYNDGNFSDIVGNTQKDIFVLELEPK